MSFRLIFRAVLPLLAVIACSNDDGPTGGVASDTTAPAIAAVTPVDEFHVDVKFDEPVSRTSAQYTPNYKLGEPGSPGELPGAAALLDDQRTVTLSTATSMAGLNLQVSVSNVSDLHGNKITTPIVEPFAGSSTTDTTPPQVVAVSPPDGAVDVPVGTPVVITLSEALAGCAGGGSITWLSEGRRVDFLAREEDYEFRGNCDFRVLWLMPQTDPLPNNALQTVTVSGVRDHAGNTMDAFQWSFTTTSAVDNIRPTLVSTRPANLARDVSVNTKLSLTFSEPMNTSIDLGVQITPEPGLWAYEPWALGKTWSSDGRTVTFEPFHPLLDNMQYTLTILPYGVVDLARNTLDGETTVTFTTGHVLEGGAISGEITGDPGSAADDPTGAIVFAINNYSPQFGQRIRGSTTVAEDNTYTIEHLPDDDYNVFALFDSGNDRVWNWGDAYGTYGASGPLDPPALVEIFGRNHQMYIYFQLFDPSLLNGTLTYSGLWVSQSRTVYVGLFKTEGFTPADTPVATVMLSWPPTSSTKWEFHSYYTDPPLPDGQYYIGAYMDVNSNQSYQSWMDPVGFVGGLATPTPFDIVNGADFPNVVIPLADPGTTAVSGTSLAWPVSERNESVARLRETIEKALAGR